MPYMPSLDSFATIYPAALMVIFAALLIVVDLIAVKERKAGVGYFAILLIVVAVVVAYFLRLDYFEDRSLVIFDNISYIFFVAFAISFVLCALGSIEYLKAKGVEKGEYYILLFFSIVGMLFMVGAADFTVFYTGLETMAISLYVIAGYEKKNRFSNEAGIKYFIMGIVASAIMLYGFSFIYGFTASTSYSAIYDVMQTNYADGIPFGLKFGFALVFVGFAFKIAAVPFHMWAPDVYTGSPTPAVGFLSVAPKTAAIVALWRMFEITGYDILYALGVVAVLSMTVGNLIAIVQDNIKRMLAYSAISHAGYVLLAVCASSHSAIALYMIVYAFMNMGAFTILSIFRKSNGEDALSFKDFAGLSKSYPLVALSMLIFMLSLAGVPPFGGFIAKFYLFGAAFNDGLYLLVLIAAINSVIGCYYYLRVCVYMYFMDNDEKLTSIGGINAYVGISISAFAIVITGILPNVLLSLL